MTSSKYFETSYGKRIKLIDGFNEIHKKRGTAQTILAEDNSKPANRQQLPHSGFRKDVYYYSLMIDMLRRNNIDLKVGKALDVGGAEGTMARLLRLEGRAEHTHVIDLYDMRGLLPDDLFESHLSRMRRHKFLSGLGFSRWAGMRKLSTFEDFRCYPNADSAYFNIRRKGPGKIDQYTIRDYYDFDSNVDLLTAFSCIDYFDPQRFFRKAGQIVNDGGLLYAHLAYWWYPVNCSLVIGDFPFASQRLNKPDFERYLKEFCPQDYKDTMQRYNYFHLGKVHPVVDDYIAYADQAGFSLIDTQRLYGGNGKITPFTPLEYNNLADTPLNEILEEINQFNPKVGLSDLYTFNVLVAFRKRGRAETTIAEAVRDLQSRSAQ